MNASSDSRVTRRCHRSGQLKRVLVVLALSMTGLASMGSGCGADLDAPGELGGLAEYRVVPQWSADGTKIAFSRPWVGAFMVEADGSRMWSLPPDASVGPSPYGGFTPRNFSPAISPDGARVAFAMVVSSGSSDLVTSNLDGSDVRKLADNRTMDAHPTWSPDGAHVVFYSDSYPDHQTSGLWIIDSDASNLRRLDVPVRPSPHPPTWSPSGDYIGFVAVQVDRVPEGESYRSVWRDIAYTVGPDGSGLAELGDAVSTPAWSPDGTRIALVRALGGEENKRHALYTMNPDGSDQREILSFDWDDYAWYDTLAWSPDGTEILYGSSSSRSDRSIVVVTVESSEVRTVGEFPGSRQRTAAWSPDGRRIAFYVNFGVGIWVDPEEANVVLLTVARDGSDRRILVRENEDRLVAVKSD